MNRKNINKKIVIPDDTYLEEISFIFNQNNDSCDSDKDGQNLVIKTTDGGVGPYLVLETVRWAINFEELEWFFDVIKNIRILGVKYGKKG